MARLSELRLERASAKLVVSVIHFLAAPCPYAVLCLQAKRDRGQDPADEAAAKRLRIEEPVQEQAAHYEAPQQAPLEEPLPQPAQIPSVQQVTPQVRVLHLCLHWTRLLSP